MTARSGDTTESGAATGPEFAGIDDPRREIKRCPECAAHFGADARFCPFDGMLLESSFYEPQVDKLLGTIVLERYQVCAMLGEGGMGTVYKVRHVALDRMFAMKVLRRDLASDAELAARFTQEARATASIKHPNVVQITDFGRLPDGVPFFVMELLVGQPLSMAIRTRGPLPRAVVCEIVIKIAHALGAAHEAGIVHRDMKPENVFLVGRVGAGGLPEEVRVVDFGAAKIMGTSRITRAGVVFGTPHFMSPEQASGGTVDHRADIYALGIIMYELFTGRVPFEADTYMGVLTQHMFVQPAPPSTVSPHAAGLGALEGVVLRALEKKPEARFRSMDELADELRRSAGRPSVMPPASAPAGSAARISIPSQVAGVPRGPSALWPLGAAIVAIVAGGMVGLWMHLHRAPDSTPPGVVPAAMVAPVVPPPAPVAPIAARPEASDADAAAIPTASPVSPPAHVRTSGAAPRAQPGPSAGRPSSIRGIGSDFTDPWKKDQR